MAQPFRREHLRGVSRRLHGRVNQRIGSLDSVLNGESTSSAEIISGPDAATRGDVVTYKVHVRGASGTPTDRVKLLLSGHLTGAGDLDGTGTATISAASPITGNLYPLVLYEGDRHYSIAQASAHPAAATVKPALQP